MNAPKVRAGPGSAASGGSVTPRGRLKVYFGAASGAGATRVMLLAGQQRRLEGVDVVVGALATASRRELEALVSGLPALARRASESEQELDLDAAVARRPALLLVDELAHVNPPGTRHAARWQDVEELLAVGVDVYSTLGVEQLASLADVVAQITRERVGEAVPDAVFERADEVEFVDARAEASGRREGDLLALRELALRRMARRVDSDVMAYRREHGIAATWPAGERIVVGIGLHASGPRLVRAAARMAAELRADWIAACVETPRLALASEEARARVGETQRLAESLGAEVVTLVDESVAEGLLKLARAHNITRIIVGKPTRSRWLALLGGSIVDTVVRRSGAIDVHVISGDAEEPGPAQPLPRGRARWRGYLAAVSQAIVTTAVANLLFEHVDRSDLILMYIVGVILVAARHGSGPSAAAAVLSVLAFDFFYFPPYFVSSVSEPRLLLTFAVMLVVGLVISSLASRIRLQAEAAHLREGRTAALYSLSRELARLRGEVDIASCAARHINATLGGRAVVLLRDAQVRLAPVEGTHAEFNDPRELAVAQWAWEHGPAGRGTATHAAAAATYVPLTVVERTVGVLGIVDGDRRLHDPPSRQLLEALCGQTALALQRVLLAKEAQAAELRAQAEELRSSLLSSVSHDLRTPLAAVTGAAGILLSRGAALSQVDRDDLVQAIHEEAARLGRLVANLLDMTRLESGALQIKQEWIPIEEPIGAALGHLEAQLGAREVQVEVDPGLPLVPLDGVLVEQLLINLVENAIKYGGAGPISITGTTEGECVVIAVADRGPGIPAGSEAHLFEKFYRAAQGPATRGVGLGLAICRAIATAHEAAITASNRVGGGAVFAVAFPVRGTPPHVPVDPPLASEEAA